MVAGQTKSVFRMDIHQDLQDQLDISFREQAGQFWNEGLEVVPFERENFHPDESEVLSIDPFDLPELIYEPIQNPVGWQVLPTDDETLGRVYCIFAYDDATGEVAFQVIGRQQRLSRDGLNIILRNDVFTRLGDPGLILSGACHAAYRGSELRFRSMWWLKQAIDIDSYYRAATDADVNQFVALACVKVENPDRLRQGAGQWVRTRLAYVLDSGVLENFTPQQLSQKAAGFGVQLQTVVEGGQEKLVIPESGRELRAALKFLEEEYYEGPITGAGYEANSKRRRVAGNG